MALKKVFIKLTTKWTSQWRRYVTIFNNITPQTECDNYYNIIFEGSYPVVYVEL